MQKKKDIISSGGFILIILILIGALSVISFTSLQWFDSKIKQTEINLQLKNETSKAEEKSEIEFDETLLALNHLDSLFNVYEKGIVFKFKSILLQEGIYFHLTPPPWSC